MLRDPIRISKAFFCSPTDIELYAARPGAALGAAHVLRRARAAGPHGRRQVPVLRERVRAAGRRGAGPHDGERRVEAARRRGGERDPAAAARGRPPWRGAAPAPMRVVVVHNAYGENGGGMNGRVRESV